MSSYASTRDTARNLTDERWQPTTGSGWPETAAAVLWAILIMSPIALIGGWKTYWSWREIHDAEVLARWNADAYERVVAAAPAAILPVNEAAHGRDLFLSVCAACHGPEGQGMRGLGKNLVTSDFVAIQSDADLCRFVVTGRPDAKPMPMPPKAGRDDLTDADIQAVVAYVRGLQDPRRLPELPAPKMILAAAPAAPSVDAVAAAGGDAELAGYIASGDRLFHSVCIACHGKGGIGIPGNGKPLHHNEFIRSLDDDALLAFVKQGRGPTDPKNTTGIQMPPKGGNPALSDDDILDVIAYLRTLQGEKPAAASGT